MIGQHSGLSTNTNQFDSYEYDGDSQRWLVSVMTEASGVTNAEHYIRAHPTTKRINWVLI